MMTIGAFVGAAMALTCGNPWIAFLVGGLAGALFGLLHAMACVSFQADQTISGTAINFLAPGLAVFLCKAIYDGSSDTPAVDISAKLPKVFDPSPWASPDSFRRDKILKSNLYAIHRRIRKDAHINQRWEQEQIQDPIIFYGFPYFLQRHAIPSNSGFFLFH